MNTLAAGGEATAETQARSSRDYGRDSNPNDARHPYQPVRGDVPPGPRRAQEQNAINIIRGMVEKHGGKILVIKKWDERKLAYEVENQKRGTYVLTYFHAVGSAVAMIERDVKLERRGPPVPHHPRRRTEPAGDGSGRAAADHPRRAPLVGARRQRPPV